MKFKKSVAVLSMLAATSMISSTVVAEDSGWYVGGNVGQTRGRIDEQKIVNDVIAIPTPHNFISDDTTDKGYKLFGGYQFNRYLALEGGYFDLGEFEFNHGIIPAGSNTATGSLNTNMKVRGANLDAVGYLPFTEKFTAFARLGVTYALTQDTFTSSTPIVLGGKLSGRDTFPKAGVGLEYKFNESFALRAEAERYRIHNGITDHNNIDLYSVGVVYRFGATKKAAPVKATPAPVAAQPAPRFEKMTLGATELFKFDSAEVTPVQPDLEKLTTTLKASSEPKKVNIVGHTDRLGSDDYNQKLSERRAEAVKNYMVDKGVPADRLVTEGKG
ncbi:MAG: flagellar motor protein MotB, partial [Moraxellaceae bacterium]